MSRRVLTATAFVAAAFVLPVAAEEEGPGGDEIVEFDEPAVIVQPWVPPEVIEEVEPEYPPERYDEGLDVKVIIRVEIDENGDVTKAYVFNSGGAGFDEAALAAARRWKFKPALEDGEPVESFAMIYVVFEKTTIPLWEERSFGNVEEEPND
ncbi:MAG: energy transducer TonB [Candidatus Coatesbacteria bacterium]|nr:MAG: energy transducer TonB [Candidatus Coatesbacteria bacterium]